MQNRHGDQWLKLLLYKDLEDYVCTGCASRGHSISPHCGTPSADGLLALNSTVSISLSVLERAIPPDRRVALKWLLGLE
jgi:hypothetical protein